jgi:hypothetical protein
MTKDVDCSLICRLSAGIINDEIKHTPAGFTESLSSDLASITDFAKKYIAAVMADGSSELTATPKKSRLSAIIFIPAAFAHLKALAH